MYVYELPDGQIVRWDRLGEGPPVVLCHGTPWSSALWRPIAAALSSRYAVHLWDMPGFGQSTQSDGQDVSLAAQARVLAGLVDHWGLDAPVVVAHDIGGAVGLRAHLLHGMPIRALALVDVVAIRPWGSPFFRLVADNAEVFSALPEPLHEALVRRYIEGAAYRQLRAEDLDTLVRPWLGPVGQAAFYRQIAQADERHTDEIESLYAQLRCPVSIVWGADDTWIPVDRAHTLAATIDGAELTVIPDAGHLVHLDAPEALTATLTGWLTRITAR
jgi:pimeloyl-ACP methyl ester carboxylesterase